MTSAKLGLGTLAGVGLLGCVAATPVSAGTVPPSKLVAEATAAATHEGSARVTVQYASKGAAGKIIEDSTSNSGKETIAIGKERVSILLTGGTAYILANNPGLVKYFGFPSAAAAAFSDRWISLGPTDKGYQAIVSDVSLSSAITAATPTGVLQIEKKTTLSGKPVTSISGFGPAGETKMVLFLASKGVRHLPVEAVVSSGSKKKVSGEIITFSHWGEKLRISVPTGVTPISSLASSG